jgi:hypothetical protein
VYFFPFGISLVGLLLALAQDLPRGGPTAAAAPINRAAPDGLKLVPGNALAFLSFDLTGLWAQPGVKPPVIAELEKGTGLTAEDFGRVSFVFSGTSPENFGAAFIVTTAKAVEPARLHKFLVSEGKEFKHGGKTYYARDESHGDAVCALNDRTFFWGDATGVRNLIDYSTAGPTEGPLSPALRLAEKYFLVGAADVTSFLKTIPAQVLDNLPAQIAPFKPLLKMQTATLVGDLGKESGFNVRLAFAKEADAKEGLKAVQLALDQARPAFAQFVKQGDKELKDAPQLLALLREAETVLKDLKPQAKGQDIEMTARVKIDSATLNEGLTQAVQEIKESSDRIRSANNLKEIGLAMHNFHDSYGSFPANAIYDKAGKPLLSWRVAILPFIEEDKLYKEFHLDEPWDSEHNKKLLEKMPKVFAPVRGKTKEKYSTFYQGFFGPGAFFEGKKGIRIGDITDGTSNTILAVEAANAVPWSKPDDLPFDPKKPLPKLGGHFKNGFNAGFCDGSVHFLKNSMKKETLISLITRNGGEVIDDY